ncbi:hypothetical protein CWI75_16310 [Kineobactrum sediminis]|uniref:TonB-dependent receptor n=1 Tax=Kineobactrum sediminis TaxID=1905677 RepID=A0A2N5XYI2_9GAMM|nr:TonB-dependent receptor [Kineobactrum sediminis]PLW81200.1 hypothetical protein CWI75_16310 [Kineobactrum sediminis]
MTKRKAMPQVIAAAGLLTIVPVGYAAEMMLEEVIVTAQKRSENINEVAMSVTALGEEYINRLDLDSMDDLQKVVPGFHATVSTYGTPIYTIRGVGFQDTSLAASPTVSVYVDEMPVPYSILSGYANLDISRTEILKGPQGILFGNNATGGAINYIANKPSDEFGAEVELGYARFGTVDFDGHVNIPVSDSLSFRLAGKIIKSDGWQKSTTTDNELGDRDFSLARFSAAWDPTEKVRVLGTVTYGQDKSDTPAPQFFQAVVQNAQTPLDPGFLNFPKAGSENREADWSSCINNSPTEDPEGCVSLAADNDYMHSNIRLEVDLSPTILLTSLTSYQKFDRFQPVESDGTTFRNYESVQMGEIDTYYQEIRISGLQENGANWVAGANFQLDDTVDTFLQSYSDSSSSQIFGLKLGPTRPLSDQDVETWAVFGNMEYPVGDFTFHAGARYTDQKRDFIGCGQDGGDGSWSTISQGIQNLLITGDPFVNSSFPDTTQGPGVDAGPGGCGTTNEPPDFAPGYVYDSLDEDNFSWRLGSKWQATDGTMFYGNVSKGYKAGSFPTAATARSLQLIPAVQESLLAYELGVKSSLFSSRVQLNGAVFFYDYEDKQIRGSVLDPVFGPLGALVNVPESEVKGFEMFATALVTEGLTLRAGVSYSDSEIKGDFTNFNYLGQQQNFTGESFPHAPEWQGSVDASYEHTFSSGMIGYVGALISYQDDTYAGFGELPELEVDSYALLDMRAGIDAGNWGIRAWGKNLTDEYYWRQVTREFGDALVRFAGYPRSYGVTVSYRWQ